MTSAVFLALALVAGVFSPRPATAVTLAECQAFLCMPGGFPPPECSPARAAVLRRIRALLPALPAWSECVAAFGWDAANLTHNEDPLIDCPRGGQLSGRTCSYTTGDGCTYSYPARIRARAQVVVDGTTAFSPNRTFTAIARPDGDSYLSGGDPLLCSPGGGGGGGYDSGVVGPPPPAPDLCDDGSLPPCPDPPICTEPPCEEGEVCLDGTQPPCDDYPPICTDPPCEEGEVCQDGTQPPCKEQPEKCDDGTDPPCEETEEKCDDGTDPPCKEQPEKCDDGTDPPCEETEEKCDDGTDPPCEETEEKCDDGTDPPCEEGGDCTPGTPGCLSPCQDPDRRPSPPVPGTPARPEGDAYTQPIESDDTCICPGNYPFPFFGFRGWICLPNPGSPVN